MSRVLTPLCGLPHPLLGIGEILAEIRKRLAIKRLFDCPEFPVDSNSLQERLLKFCGARKWLQKPKEELRKAEESRRSAFEKVKKEQIFGVHPRGGKSKDYAYVFRPDTSPNELFALNRALQSNNPGNALSHPEVVGIIARKFSLGAGDAVVRFLAARLEAYHPAAKESTESMREPVFNAALLFAAEHWTDPGKPLWLMPGAAAAKIVETHTGEKVSRESFNGTARAHGLHRIDQKIWGELAALKEAADVEGWNLRKEFECAMGMPLAGVRRGRGAQRQVE